MHTTGDPHTGSLPLRFKFRYSHQETRTQLLQTTTPDRLEKGFLAAPRDLLSNINKLSRGYQSGHIKVSYVREELPCKLHHRRRIISVDYLQRLNRCHARCVREPVTIHLRLLHIMRNASTSSLSLIKRNDKD